MRRAPALLALAAAGLVAALALAGCGGSGAAPGTTTTAATLERLRIIFPEGLNVREMGARVAEVRRIAIAKRGVTPKLTRASYLAAAKRARPPKAFVADWKRGHIEGFLFPALYEFSQVTTGRELVDDQLAAFRRAFAKVDLRYARSKRLTPYDVLTIASMIEKETVAPAERKLVAAVIYNRLRKRMPLGIDATIRYGLDIPGTASLTKTALRSDTPYNSRRFPGLPPTPIANPGLASLQAAAHPARVDYLYYVRIPGTKRHFFTADEGAFLRKVCAFGYACS
ncbi:YceG-like protein [Gaiella occulta]|uniref:YceG-like protein n=1 Tax=Gaiella occulta TaxID=1002870 RepID=A0A7M2YY99_9ACTN|nr:endolytic transglycosylase MltG [Gaiella occulta]RDI75050.1 YceG-like protein [Gaiella occulta]